MKIYILFEYSGVVREAFSKLGHDVTSVDILPTEIPGEHYQGDVFDLDYSDADLIIAHPPCTHLCVSGNRWYSDSKKRVDAAKFVLRVWNLQVDKMCIENPVGVLNTLLPELPKPQYIQPWQFGHGETKKTGLWLRNLPNLSPSNIVDGRENRIHKMPPSKDRGKERSKTYTGIAEAMASQWG